MSFRLREWFLLLVAVCLALGWFVHTREQSKTVKRLESEMESLEHVQRPYLVHGNLTWREVKELEGNLRLGSDERLISISRMRDGDVRAEVESVVNVFRLTDVGADGAAEYGTETRIEHRTYRFQRKDQQWKRIIESQWQD